MFNYKKMQKIFRAKPDSFVQRGFEKVNCGDLNYYFKDNGSNILAVAHLDSVEGATHFKVLKLPHRQILFSPVLDDRLGVYLITELLPRLGVQHDILLTEGEEQGRSTAVHFDPRKEYNWMYSFDRTGDDAVMYEYGTPELEKTLHSYGWKVDRGIFSDICFLEHLGCKGFNFGTYYYNYHSLDAWADLIGLEKGVERFLKFYEDHKKVKMKHSPLPTSVGQGSSLDFENFYRCYMCDSYVNIDELWGAYSSKDAEDMLWEELCEDCYFDHLYDAFEPLDKKYAM